MKFNYFIIVPVVFVVLLLQSCSDPVSKSDDNSLSEDANGDFHIFVNPSGDNKNGGTSPSIPLKNIFKAIEIAPKQKGASCFIHLSEGIYSAETNGEIFPLEPNAFTKIIGAGEDKTVIKGQKTDEHRKSIIFNIQNTQPIQLGWFICNDIWKVRVLEFQIIIF